MAQKNTSGVKTYTASTALGKFLRVAPSSGKMALADESTMDHGTVESPAFEADDDVSVRLRNVQGTAVMVASEAIALFAEVFAAAGGKVASSGSVKIGVAETIASADGDHIEVNRTE